MHASGLGRVGFIVLLASIGLSGCGQEEELKLDPGVSPFYPGDSAKSGATDKTDPAAGKLQPFGSPTPLKEATVPSRPIRPDEVEKQIRIALHSAQKGEAAKAGQILDQVLAVEPFNREALTGRGVLWLEQASSATSSAADRAAAASHAADLARTVRRVYESPKKREMELYARALSAEAKTRVQQGQNDRALATVKEAANAGLDPYSWVELDETMAPLRSSPSYQSTLKAFEDSRLALARGKIKDRLDKPLTFPFDFKLLNLEDKPASLADFRGKVVLLDFWGTWCGPCRESIPGLIELSRKFGRRGLAVVGLTYEQSDPADPATRENVKTFVKQSGIPYPVLMGDESTIKKVPNFKGFPTSMVVDRAGNVRMLITENDANTLEVIEDAVVVLLAEPAPVAAKPK
jgi:thiol-disulfide isomerase/thioredoxin